MVLLLCGPLLESLPLASLAAIVAMAFKSLFLNGIAEVKFAFKVSRSDFWSWVVAFLSTLILGITPGISAAVATDIAYLFYKTARPSYASLGRLENTERIYKKRRRFQDAKAVE